MTKLQEFKKKSTKGNKSETYKRALPSLLLIEKLKDYSKLAV
jgi:hypothetical protein